MARTSSVIEINGNRYDAATGQLLGVVKKGANHIKTSATGMVDGFNRHSAAHRKKIPAARVARSGIKHAAQSVHSAPQRSKTLVRAAVAKPAKKAAESVRRAPSAPQPGKHADFFRPKKSPVAGAVAKHSQVKRFGHLPQPHESNTQNVSSGEIVQKPKHFDKQSSPATASRPLPSMTASASHQHLERLLDRALTTANAHEQLSAPRSRGRRLFYKMKKMPKLSIAAVLLVVTGTSAFFAWQNVPQVAVRVAATRANINASVPGYAPDGFRFAAPVSYADGVVTVKFKDKNNRAYVITQQKSNWDSTSLESSVLSANTQVQTSQVKGTTVYIYGQGSDATWVDQGIRYTLTDKANLSSDQILKIAQSL